MSGAFRICRIKSPVLCTSTSAGCAFFPVGEATHKPDENFHRSERDTNLMACSSMNWFLRVAGVAVGLFMNDEMRNVFPDNNSS